MVEGTVRTAADRARVNSVNPLSYLLGDCQSWLAEDDRTTHESPWADSEEAGMGRVGNMAHLSGESFWWLSNV